MSWVTRLLHREGPAPKPAASASTSVDEPMRERSNEPLIVAAATGDLSAVNALLGSGETIGPVALNAALVRTSWRDPSSTTEAIAKALLEAGADPDSKDECDGCSALHFAVRSSNLELVRLLIKGGADVNFPRSDGYTPRDIAEEIGDSGIVAMLGEAAWAEPRASWRTVEGDALLSAVRDGDSSGVREAIERGADVDSRDGWGDPALVVAAEEHRLEIIEILLAHGADPDAPGRANTPLTAAIEESLTISPKERQETIRLLIQAGADIEMPRPCDHWTPLMVAEWNPLCPEIEDMIRAASSSASPKD